MSDKHARQNFDNFLDVLSRQTFLSSHKVFTPEKKITPLIVDSCSSGSLFPAFQDQPIIVIAYAYVRRKENKGFKIQKILGAAQNSVGRIVSVLVRDPGRRDTCLSVEYAERCDRISSKCLSDSEGTKENNQVLTTTVTCLQISCGFWKIRKKAR